MCHIPGQPPLVNREHLYVMGLFMVVAHEWVGGWLATKVAPSGLRVLRGALTPLLGSSPAGSRGPPRAPALGACGREVPTRERSEKQRPARRSGGRPKGRLRGPGSALSTQRPRLYVTGES